MFVQVIQDLSQLLHVLLVGLEQHGLEVHRQPVSTKQSRLSAQAMLGRMGGRTHRWINSSTLQPKCNLPQYWLHKHTQSFYVNPCDESFAEIHFEPSNQGPLERRQQHLNHFTYIQYMHTLEKVRYLQAQMISASNPHSPLCQQYCLWSRTNCFFLSVHKRVISSLSAFISSSLYWKSRTVNLGQDTQHTAIKTHTQTVCSPKNRLPTNT